VLTVLRRTRNRTGPARTSSLSLRHPPRLGRSVPRPGPGDLRRPRRPRPAAPEPAGTFEL